MSERDDAAYIEHLEARVKELEGEMKALRLEKGISGVRDGLTYNERTGLWADSAGLLYCSTCLDQEKRNPMKSELPYGWRCSAIPQHYFHNPDHQPQVIRTRPPGGRQGWMR